MESTIIPLELAFEHRNYLPSIGLLLPLFYYLGCAGQVNKYTRSRFALMSAIILLLGLYTHLRAWQWSDNIRMYLTEVQYHPKSARANYEAGKVFGQRLERSQGDPMVNYREAIKHFEQVTVLQDNSASGLFGSILASIDTGNEINPQWIDELALRLATKPLQQVSLLWLDKITDCVARGKCRKNDLQVPRLVKSALSYKEVSKHSKSMLYTILAKYYYKVEKDYKKAVVNGEKAISAKPSTLYFQLNLVKYLISSGDKIKAGKALDSISRVDINSQHTAEIAKLRRYIE
jgi:tetratricopeptide (TPR) repeat protein